MSRPPKASSRPLPTEAARAPLRGDELFRTIFESSSVGLCLGDPQQGRILRANRKFAELVGYTQEELRRLSFRDLTHPDDRDADWHDYQKLVAGEIDEYRVEKRYVRKDGELRWLRVDASMRRDEEGRPLHAVAMVHDVTAEKRYAETLRRAREDAERRAREAEEAQSILEGLLQHIPMGIAVANPDLSVRAASRWGRAMLGRYEFPDDDLGVEAPARPWHVYHLDGTTPATPDEMPITRAVRRGEVVEEEEWLIARGDHEPIPILCTAAPIRDAHGRILGGVVGWQDISEHKRMEAALREADRRKDEFLATLAHELRNPLAPVRTGLELLAGVGQDPEEVERIRGMMERHVTHLARLVDDLLDVSRISRGVVELRPSEVVLQDVLQNAIEASRPLFQTRAHRLVEALPPEPLTLRGDPTRLGQVFANLLNNAAQYTSPGGEIRLAAEAVGDEIVVRVKDDGAGVPEHLLTKIFDMFARGGEPPHAKGAGLGIGLTLVKSLVELHGGTVRALSEGPGRGSEFVVRLPRRESPPSRRAPKAHGSTGAPARVLVVDDDRDLADSCALLLERRGHAVRVAYDGPGALDAVTDFAPDLVLLDLGLPGMGGCAVARAIRTRCGDRGPRLVALTGRDRETDRARTRESGFHAHLVKPVALEAVERLIGGLESEG